MPGNRFGLHAAEIADVASAVDGRIAVQQLPVPARSRHADTVAMPRHRREVAGTDNVLRLIPRPTDEGHGRLLPVVEVDPLKTGPLEIHFMERRLGPVEPVEIAHPPVDPTMRVVI